MMSSNNDFERIFSNKQECLKFWYEHYKNGSEKDGVKKVNNWITTKRLMPIIIGDDAYWERKSSDCQLFLEVLRDSELLKKNKFENKLNFANLDFNNFEVIEWNDSDNVPTFKITAINDENEEIKVGIIISEITNMNVDFSNINKVSDEVNNLMIENCKLFSKEYSSLYLIIKVGIDPNRLTNGHYGNYAIQLLDQRVYQKETLPFTSVFEIPKIWTIE